LKIASTSFESTNSAAVSHSAFSFRRNSRSSSLILRRSDWVCIAVNVLGNLLVRARAYPGAPLVEQTLNKQIEQASILMQNTVEKPSTALVDLGCRGVDRDNPELTIIHRRKAKSLGEPERKLIQRRDAVEPVIAHLKPIIAWIAFPSSARKGFGCLRCYAPQATTYGGCSEQSPARASGTPSWKLPPELVWAIRRHLTKTLIRIIPSRVHEMAPN